MSEVNTQLEKKRERFRAGIKNCAERLNDAEQERYLQGIRNLYVFLTKGIWLLQIFSIAVIGASIQFGTMETLQGPFNDASMAGVAALAVTAVVTLVFRVVDRIVGERLQRDTEGRLLAILVKKERVKAEELNPVVMEMVLPCRRLWFMAGFWFWMSTTMKLVGFVHMEAGLLCGIVGWAFAISTSHLMGGIYRASAIAGVKVSKVLEILRMRESVDEGIFEQEHYILPDTILEGEVRPLD